MLHLHHHRPIGAKDAACARGNCISKAGARRVSLKRLASPKVPSASGSNVLKPRVLPLCAAGSPLVRGRASRPSNPRRCPASWVVAPRPTACAAKSGRALALVSSSSAALASAIIQHISPDCSNASVSACSARSGEPVSASQQSSKTGATPKRKRSKKSPRRAANLGLYRRGWLLSAAHGRSHLRTRAPDARSERNADTRPSVGDWRSDSRWPLVFAWR
jgi:hypothetical protein